MLGTITHLRIDRGFGFIAPAGSTSGKGVFFHIHDLDASLEFSESLMERRVQFTTTSTEKGERAVNVRPAD